VYSAARGEKTTRRGWFRGISGCAAFRGALDKERGEVAIEVIGVVIAGFEASPGRDDRRPFYSFL